mgnify:CR=1 FL=1
MEPTTADGNRHHCCRGKLNMDERGWHECGQKKLNPKYGECILYKALEGWALFVSEDSGLSLRPLQGSWLMPIQFCPFCGGELEGKE